MSIDIYAPFFFLPFSFLRQSRQEGAESQSSWKELHCGNYLLLLPVPASFPSMLGKTGAEAALPKPWLPRVTTDSILAVGTRGLGEALGIGMSFPNHRDSVTHRTESFQGLRSHMRWSLGCRYLGGGFSFSLSTIASFGIYPQLFVVPRPCDSQDQSLNPRERPPGECQWEGEEPGVLPLL